MEFKNDSEVNGLLDNFPLSVFSFYKTRFTTTITPTFIEGLTGSRFIDIQDHDIYIMGKRKGEKANCFWTKIRLLSSESSRNSLQGLLEVKLLEGYGFMNVGSNSDAKVMRPTNIQKLVTRDSVAFKKRAIVHIKGDVFLPLEGVDSHLRIPLMDEETLCSFEKSSNSRKREAYARKKASNNEWSHVNRVSMKKEHKKLIIRMVTPYKKNLGSGYWIEFLNDLFTECLELKQEFIQDVTENDKEQFLEDLTHRVLGKVNKNNGKKRCSPGITGSEIPSISTMRSLKNIPSTDVSW